MGKCQILLTNDDGIQSPGLWAAAEVLSDLGFVTVAAPQQQSSGMGRSLPSSSDGIIQTKSMRICGRDWIVHAVGGARRRLSCTGFWRSCPSLRIWLSLASITAKMWAPVSPSPGRSVRRWRRLRMASRPWPCPWRPDGRTTSLIPQTLISARLPGSQPCLPG